MKTEKCEFLVIGSGLAGLAYALKVADHGRACVLSKAKLDSGNSQWAQGGIAAVTSKEDSFARHIEDTLLAGAGLCDPRAVKHVVEEAPKRIDDLVHWGVRFDLDERADFSLHQEGGHSRRRILHIEDHTGAEIHKTLLQKARAHSNIQLFEEQYAVDLLLDASNSQCLGALVLDKNSQTHWVAECEVTVLATGGAGKVFLYTSNWEGAVGDGIAMAYRAGAAVANLEFTQFHPTCLFHPQGRSFLISEALRGEGGEIVNNLGEPFLKSLHPMGSLAPRDIVARGIDQEMRISRTQNVFLDVTSKSKDFLKRRFPTIFFRCQSLGLDISTQPIPVVPAAHYLCGGVQVGPAGETSVQKLFAIGEVANTGLHGANRLASNSLLECLVFAHDAALKSIAIAKEARNQGGSKKNLTGLKEIPECNGSALAAKGSNLWTEIRQLMWSKVGIVRNFAELKKAEHRMSEIIQEVQRLGKDSSSSFEFIELKNLATVAHLMALCALNRRESRGTHFNSDLPFSISEFAMDTVIKKQGPMNGPHELNALC